MKSLKALIILTIITSVSLTTGCASLGRKTLFSKEGDGLSHSACEPCQGKPFYVNGHWI